jgi:8-amino-7-oxononanoate synthase
MSLFDKCRNFTRANELKEVEVYPYFSPIASAQRPEIQLNGQKMLMLGSNSYLGLTTHPKIVKAAREAVEQYGSSCTGSRFLNGTLELHEELERRLAAFVKKEKALVFTTGFQANLGTISTLVGKDDVVITDKTDHASIIDGARLSFGRMYRFNHNSIEDLERVLNNCDGNGNGKLIVIDGVFSMDGDIADLPGIVEVAERYGVGVMVDDAHGLGVLGPRGEGTSGHFGLTDKIDLIMGTFSKSFASIGGFVAGDSQVIDYVQHFARSLIFSASLPPAQAAAALASLDIIEGEPQRREALWSNTHFLKEGLKELGYDTGMSETPIIPVLVGDDLLCFKMWRLLQTEGIFVNPIISPAVPPGQALIRVSIMATHVQEQLQHALDIFEKTGKQLGII